jgi:hypothetical protein
MDSVSAQPVPGPQAAPKVGAVWNYIKFFRDPIGTL